MGRRCRDVFISLKKTCRKLGVSISCYSSDRLSGAKSITRQVELMAAKAKQTPAAMIVESG